MLKIVIEVDMNVIMTDDGQLVIQATGENASFSKNSGYIAGSGTDGG